MLDLKYIQENKKNAKGLICFDMDGTLIDAETLDVIAKEIGVEKQVIKITDLAMNGQLDFEESLKKRLELLKGVSEKKIKTISNNFKLMPGAKELVLKLRQKGFVVCIITGGFDIVAEKIGKKLGIDFIIANTLELENGKINGDFQLRVNGNKHKLLRKIREAVNAKITVAVGDGANDLLMLEEADIGIGFNVKPKLNKQVKLKIKEKNLLKVLDFIENK
jgi:phosphoserine phosphatase